MSKVSTMRESAKKLYLIADPGFRLPAYVVRDEAIGTYSAAGFPFMHWPDGRWCYEINAWLEIVYRSAADDKLARNNTTSQYAADLSHLIRFCHKKNYQFLDLCNDEFTKFINELTVERSTKEGRELARSGSRVVTIGKTALSFLEYCACLYGRDGYVGPRGEIVATIKRRRINRGGLRNSAWIEQESDISGKGPGLSFQHSSFPAKSPKRRRDAITDDAISALRLNAVKTGGTYRQRRRLITILTAEVTGCRRGEIAHLLVEDLLVSLDCENPSIQLTELLKKKGKKHGRIIPIPRDAAREILDFIKFVRHKVFKKPTKAQRESGELFLNCHTGRPIKRESLTKEMGLLQALGGVTGNSSLHAFRHRYITNRFLACLEQSNVIAKSSNARVAKVALLSIASVRAQLMQELGDISDSTFDHYLHVAWAKYVNGHSFKSAVEREEKLSGLLDQLNRLVADGRSGGTQIDTEKVAELLQKFDTGMIEPDIY